MLLLRTMTRISVWEYNPRLKTWSLNKTTDILETKDEEKYLRVLRNTGSRHLEKHFYYSAEDYFKHAKPIEYNTGSEFTISGKFSLNEKFNEGESLEE